MWITSQSLPSFSIQIEPLHTVNSCLQKQNSRAHRRSYASRTFTSEQNNHLPYGLRVYRTIQENSHSKQWHSHRHSQSQEGNTEHLAAVSTAKTKQGIGLTLFSDKIVLKNSVAASFLQKRKLTLLHSHHPDLQGPF